MSNVTVNKTDAGWTVVANGKTFTITDENKNGKWDNKDLIKALNSGDTLSAEDRIEARYKISEIDGVTSDEMALMEEYKQHQAALNRQEAELKAQQTETKQTATKTVSQPKKRGKFWSTCEKIGEVGFALLPALTGIAGMCATLGSWSFNSSNANDTAQKVFNITTGATMALSGTALTLRYLNNKNNVYTTTPCTTLDFSSLSLTGNKTSTLEEINASRQTLASQYDAAIESLGKNDKEEADGEKEAEKTATDILTEINQSGINSQMSTLNGKFVRELETQNDDKINTNDNKTILEFIQKYPYISYKFANLEPEANSDIDKEKLFQKINDVLQQYAKAESAQTGSGKSIMTKDAFEEFEIILSNKENPTANDLKTLQKIYTNLTTYTKAQ